MPEPISHACTHAGPRARNEDAHGVHPELGLYTVADGMGGYEGGALASQIVVRTIHGFVRRALDDVEHRERVEAREGEALLRAAIERANAAVTARCHGRLANMGSTVVALALIGGRAVIGHVGDSRLYRLRSGILESLTRDHTLHNAMTDAGVDLYPGPRAEAFRHVLTRVLGRPDAAPEVRSERVLPGDVFLLCSDGLPGGVDDGVMAHDLGTLRPVEACQRLVQRAVTGGGHDNVTVLVVAIPGTSFVRRTPGRPGHRAASCSTGHVGRARARLRTPRAPEPIQHGDPRHVPGVDTTKTPDAA